MPIHVLPPDVSSKIAAGEVTERPASVVKELIENSLDAGATEISIELRGGGVDLIRVVDNGVGIPSAEAGLAFERFATSKLADPSDLGSIATLGFRGEALPSIGAVSHATMVTRPPAETSGTRIEVSEGRVVGSSPEGAPPGTSVTVRQLFRNVPARRKFLRSASAEASRDAGAGGPVHASVSCRPVRPARRGSRGARKHRLGRRPGGGRGGLRRGRGRGDAGARPAGPAGRRQSAESVGDDRARVGLTGQP